MFLKTILFPSRTCVTKVLSSVSQTKILSRSLSTEAHEKSSSSVKDDIKQMKASVLKEDAFPLLQPTYGGFYMHFQPLLPNSKRCKERYKHKANRKQLAIALLESPGKGGKIIETHINPYVDEWEAAEQYPAHKVLKKLGEAGFLGVCRPVEYGGLGLDFRYSVALAEALGSISCGGIPMSIAVQTDMATPALARFGSEYLKKEFLVPTIAGDVVTCLGVSEPSAGSDVASIKTTARRVGDDLVINGQKMWITNGCQADWMCLLANTSEGHPHKNKSLICLPMKSPGVHVAKKISKIGMWSSDTAQIFFEDVRIPAKNIIGEEGHGFFYQMLQFQEERLIGAALALPALDRCINETIEYTKQREVFGSSVLSNQTVHFRLAELQTEIEALKCMVHKATDTYVEGEDVTLLASMAKLKAGRLLREVSDSCLQFWGGMGFTNEVFVSRMYRDMRLVSIGAGADEVMLGIICKLMGTLPKPAKK